MPEAITHAGFSDESNWNKGRFRSLCLVSLPIELLKPLQEELAKLLQESGIKTEFKWSNLRSAREKFAAEKICDYILYHASLGELRVDVLIWDISDNRHNIQRRDDIANLQRMYYKLFLNVLRNRWPKGATWKLFPDENSVIKWDQISDCIEAKSWKRKEYNTPSLLGNLSNFSESLRKEFNLLEIVQTSSKETPFLQVADLFSGLAVFSREKYKQYMCWAEQQGGQQFLFQLSEEYAFSKADEPRFYVLQHFFTSCKKAKMGVGLKSHEGLTTVQPKNPINFWFYKPQHPDDKAPTKH